MRLPPDVAHNPIDVFSESSGGPPFFQMGDVVTNTCKVCFHAKLFTLNQVLYFIEFICLTFPNLVQLQLGAYSLIIEVRWSTL